MDLLARKAGDRFVYVIVAIHFLGGEALNVLARVRAAIQERWHLIGRWD
jgi:hypothetical protein